MTNSSNNKLLSPDECAFEFANSIIGIHKDNDTQGQPTYILDMSFRSNVIGKVSAWHQLTAQVEKTKSSTSLSDAFGIFYKKMLKLKDPGAGFDLNCDGQIRIKKVHNMLTIFLPQSCFQALIGFVAQSGYEDKLTSLHTTDPTFLHFLEKESVTQSQA